MSVPPIAFSLGIDVGSTTAKAVLIRENGTVPNVEATAYGRHEAKLAEALQTVIGAVTQQCGDISVSVVFTGSAGMGIAERVHLPFVQEVHAACTLVSRRYCTARSLLDIGGEDSKLVTFNDRGLMDARMNGGCAGGTGAFLDQMAALLSVDTAELEYLAQKGKEVHPIATRCGVFAKTDVQNILSLGVGKPDVALRFSRHGDPGAGSVGTRAVRDITPRDDRWTAHLFSDATRGHCRENASRAGNAMAPRTGGTR